jgi:hypothetical protein
MDPSLAYVSAASGRLLEGHRLSDHRAGIRHISVAADGEVAVAMQYEGMVAHPGSLPLLAYRPESGELRTASAPEDVQRKMHAYAASVCLAASRSTAGITCPRGRLVAFYDLSSASSGKPCRSATQVESSSTAAAGTSW